MKTEWQGIEMSDLVEAQLNHFHDLIGTRVMLEGPPVRLAAASAQGIGMALHELATNAAKYGALSNGEGKVCIRWQLTAGRGSDLFDVLAGERWSEGANSYSKRLWSNCDRTDGRGCGQRNRRHRLSRAGSFLELERPSGGCGGVSPHQVSMSRRNITRDNLHEARILVVEDEPMLAYAFEECLVEAGFEIAGVAGRVSQALKMIERGESDAAVIDANLAGVSAGPIASALVARSIPYIVVSGYSQEQQRGAFPGALFIQKPCGLEDLVRAVGDLFVASLPRLPSAP